MKAKNYILDDKIVDTTYEVQTIGLAHDNPTMGFDPGPFLHHDAIGLRVPGLEGTFLVPFSEFQEMFRVAQEVRREKGILPPVMRKQ